MNQVVTQETLAHTRQPSPEAARVRAALIERGLETPLVENGLSRQQKYERIRDSFRPSPRPSVWICATTACRKRPTASPRCMSMRFSAASTTAPFPKISVIDNKMQVEEMVLVDDIELTSTCEHHFVTIDGSARVAYIPGRRIIGLSKINRIVRFFAQRPQVQERLTQQVLVALQTLLETDDVAVTIDAVHYCVKSRGVMDGNSSTRTTALGGAFKVDPATRGEFLR
jgi:GTP cyclohydrolase I